MYRGARQQTLNMRRTELAFLLHVINRSKNRTREWSAIYKFPPQIHRWLGSLYVPSQAIQLAEDLKMPTIPKTTAQTTHIKLTQRSRSAIVKLNTSIVRLLMKCALGCRVNSTFFSITAHLIPERLEWNEWLYQRLVVFTRTSTSPPKIKAAKLTEPLSSQPN